MSTTYPINCTNNNDLLSYGLMSFLVETWRQLVKQTSRFKTSQATTTTTTDTTTNTNTVSLILVA